MGVAYYYKGDYSKAVECYQEDLEVRKELGDKRGISVIIGNLGSVFLNRGLYYEAIENYGQCIEIKKELGDKRGISTFTGNMGIAYTELGEFEKAIECYSRSIITAQELNYTRQVSISTGNLANAYRETGMIEDAIVCYDKAIKEIDAENKDWHKPIKILVNEIKLQNLEHYIVEISNQDRWAIVRKLLTSCKTLPDNWYLIHWINEEWRRNHIRKDFFIKKSTLGVFSNHSLHLAAKSIRSFCALGLHIAGPLLRFNILN